MTPERQSVLVLIVLIAAAAVLLVIAGITFQAVPQNQRGSNEFVVIAALVTGAITLTGTGVTYWLGARSQRSIEELKTRLQRELMQETETARHALMSELEELKSELANRNSVEAAKRDYQYDARQRLYKEVEPILFQVYEALEEAHYRVRSLARTSRAGRLGAGRDSWISTNGYYLQSTIYKLLLPATHLRLMQRRMTFVDLGLDDAIRLRYALLKLYSRSFTDDFIFAAIEPKLPYDPNNPDARAESKLKPDVYARQALVLGDLENVCEAMLVREESSVRAMAFNEVEPLLRQAESERDTSLHELLVLFQSFDPVTKPVLARMLLAQACLGQLILSTYHRQAGNPDLRIRLATILTAPELSKSLAWSTQDACAADLQRVGTYLQERLEWLYTDGAWTEVDKS